MVCSMLMGLVSGISLLRFRIRITVIFGVGDAFIPLETVGIHRPETRMK